MSGCRISKKYIEEALSIILQGRGAGKVPSDRALSMLRYASEGKLSSASGFKSLLEVLEYMDPEKARDIRSRCGL
ncbi:MAG: hypothetical protein RMJ00_05860 [Nitrososphaerota archaeon]|nr:hypothetical protein [Candidatus Bathyarchaeota archaeon]MCX8162186.1 hypothetical protein [Candidatus Bathyarchaeota archaeon]MDW8062204.1 hypothetical protein [Nitrososphaerota archaeon]